jgi:hypothetical protein
MTAALQSRQEGLDRISQALRRLAGDQEDDRAGHDGVPVGTVSESEQALPAIVPEQPAALPLQALLTVTSSVPLIDALRDLQQARARSMRRPAMCWRR